jgi:Dolichyl-phosphate-mannose-protein mannosyltransferase
VRWVIPLGVFALLIASALGDHYFRDEFYYLACTRRLDWGYVDHPPLSVALLWLVRHVAGESLIALRAAAAALAALSVWTTGSIARRLGAGAYGEALAMTAAGLAPVLLATASFYSMNVVEVFVWTLSARILIDVLEAPTLGRWIALGVVLGLGLENKISVLWLGAGIAAALVLTPARRQLLTPGPWVAAAIAGALLAPHVIWQIGHGWPTLEFIQNASRDKMQATAPLAFVAEQVLNMNPLLLPVWLGGLLFLLVTPRFRALAIVFLTVAAILVLNRTSRASYLAPAYPMLFAAGGVALERSIVRGPLRVALMAIAIAAGAISAPLAIPLLPVDRYVQYSRALGQAPSTEEKKDVGRLPQFFADRQGWDRMVDQIAAAFDRLSPAERASAAVLVGNYGEAGAIELLGRDRGFTAISGHNNYWLWGPAGRTGDVLIVVSRSRERQEQRFTSVEQAGVIDCGDCMPYENGQFIFICRGLEPPSLQERWPQFRHYE